MSVFSLTVLLVGLLRCDVLGRPLDPVLLLAADPGGAEVDELHLAGLVQHDVGGLQVAVEDPAAVHVRHRAGHLAEDQHELTQLGRLDLVERLALDVFHQQLGPLDLEPRLLQPAIEDLGDRRVVQLLRRLEFGQRLLDVDLILGLLLADHFQGITLAASRLVADQQDRAAGAGAERVDHAILHAGELGCTRRVRHAVPRFNWGFDPRGSDSMFGIQ